MRETSGCRIEAHLEDRILVKVLGFWLAGELIT